MNSAEQVLAVADITFDKCNVMFAVKLIDITISLEETVFSRKVNFRFTLDQLLVSLSVFLQIFDCNEFQVIFLSQLYQLRSTHHGAVISHDFAAESAFVHTGKSQKVHCCFSVSVSFKNSIRL